MGKRKTRTVRSIELSGRDYLHGKLIAAGDRQVLLVQTQEASWTWFPYQQCRQLLLGFKRPDTDKATAYREAVAYARNGALPASPNKVIYRVSNEQDELVVKYLQELSEKPDVGQQGS